MELVILCWARQNLGWALEDLTGRKQDLLGGSRSGGRFANRVTDSTHRTRPLGHRFSQMLPYQLSDFPCVYLGLPLSLKMLTRDQLQSVIDKIDDRIPGWKADPLMKPRRRILVQFVMTGMLIYLAMSVDLPA
jgi:hypothetical protein